MQTIKMMQIKPYFWWWSLVWNILRLSYTFCNSAEVSLMYNLGYTMIRSIKKSTRFLPTHFGLSPLGGNESILFYTFYDRIGITILFLIGEHLNWMNNLCTNSEYSCFFVAYVLLITWVSNNKRHSFSNPICSLSTHKIHTNIKRNTAAATLLGVWTPYSKQK